MPLKILPLAARDPHQPQRASTQLELLFDLVSVVAIAAVTGALHHGISAGHGPEMLLRFALLFAVIWWAWMNYTWFASAFDNGDAPFVLLTMLVMGGAALLAGGVESIAETMDFSYALIGWVVMRAGMIALWLRAAANAAYRTTALRYALGIGVAQLLWISLYLAVPGDHPAFLAGFLAIFLVELAVPVWAERARATPWHRHHMIERYGLLNIIVLGEVIASVGTMFGQLYGGQADGTEIGLAAVSGLVIVFALWRLYFLEGEDHLQTSNLPRALAWGYGHVVVFAAGALVAAGLGAVMDVAAHHSAIGLRAASTWVAAPVALYLGGLWFIRDRFLSGQMRRALLLWGALLLAALAAAGAPVPLAAVALVLIAAARGAVARQRPGT